MQSLPPSVASRRAGGSREGCASGASFGGPAKGSQQVVGPIWLRSLTVFLTEFLTAKKSSGFAGNGARPGGPLRVRDRASSRGLVR